MPIPAPSAHASTFAIRLKPSPRWPGRPAAGSVLLGVMTILLSTAAPGRAAESAPAATNRFEKEALAFEALDRTNPPPTGAVVVAGSSTIRIWHADMKADLSPLTVVPRGFGGSTMSDLLRLAPRIVVPCRPRAVVVYEGDNDIAGNVPPAQIRDRFVALVALLRKDLPDVRIYCVSIKPSPSRWDKWPQTVAANALLKAACEAGRGLRYIDVTQALLGPDGQPQPELYRKDRLHMTRPGYVLWSQALNAVLQAEEGRYEKAK